MLDSQQDITGEQGEAFAYLALTSYQSFPHPLFAPRFLGEKWPTIDFYVELRMPENNRPFFFCQVKATSKPLTARARTIQVRLSEKDVAGMKDIPAPTYLLGVDESSRRVFAKSIHQETPTMAISSISLSNELTEFNLKALHNEVRKFWCIKRRKPSKSRFE